MPNTKQINLRIEPEHEALAREVIERIRRGGPAFREALESFMTADDSARYMPASVLRDRFDRIETRLARLEERDRGPD